MEPDALLKSLELVLAEDQRRVLRVGGDPPRVYERYGVSQLPAPTGQKVECGLR